MLKRYSKSKNSYICLIFSDIPDVKLKNTNKIGEKNKINKKIEKIFQIFIFTIYFSI